MRVVTCLFLLVTIQGCFTEGNNEGGDAVETRDMLAADTIQKTGRAKRSVVMTGLANAGSIVLSVKSAVKNKQFQDGMEMNMNEIKLDIANSHESIKGSLMEVDFENTVNKPAQNLIYMIEKFSNRENRPTKIKDYMNATKYSDLNNIMASIHFLIKKDANLLNVTMRNDPYHRKSTLVSMQNKMLSTMKLTIFAHAVRVSLRGNSTKMIDYIANRWYKGSLLSTFSETLTNITIFDEVALRDDTPEPENEIHFPELIDRFNKVSEIMRLQIEQQLFEDSFWKVRNLVELTMTEVEKNDFDDGKMRKAKVEKLKQKLDDMYTNDRYFVLAHDTPFVKLFDRVKYDVTNSQKENWVVVERHLIVVFRAKPKENYNEKVISKPQGNVLSQEKDCDTSMPSRDNDNGSLIVISVTGEHEFLSDLDYKTVRDDSSKCDRTNPTYYLPTSLRARVAHTAYILYG